MISTEGIAEEWVARLRNGNYNKGTRYLKQINPDGLSGPFPRNLTLRTQTVYHCAQGVLAEILVERGIFTQERYGPIWVFKWTAEAIEKFDIGDLTRHMEISAVLPTEVFSKVLENERMERVDLAPYDLPIFNLGTEAGIWYVNDHGMQWSHIADKLQKRMVKA